MEKTSNKRKCSMQNANDKIKHPEKLQKLEEFTPSDCYIALYSNNLFNAIKEDTIKKYCIQKSVSPTELLKSKRVFCRYLIHEYQLKIKHDKIREKLKKIATLCPTVIDMIHNTNVVDICENVLKIQGLYNKTNVFSYVEQMFREVKDPSKIKIQEIHKELLWIPLREGVSKDLNINEETINPTNESIVNKTINSETDVESFIIENQNKISGENYKILDSESRKKMKSPDHNQCLELLMNDPMNIASEVSIHTYSIQENISFTQDISKHKRKKLSKEIVAVTQLNQDIKTCRDSEVNTTTSKSVTGSHKKPETIKQKKSIDKSDNENKHENVIKSLNKEVNSCSSKSIISDNSSSSNGKPENLKQKKSIGKSDNENKNVIKLLNKEVNSCFSKSIISDKSSSSNGKPENLKQKKSIGKSDNENKHEYVIKSLNKEVNSCSSKSIISDKSSSSNRKPENLKQKKSIGKSDNENKHENVIKSLNKEVNSCSSKSIISDKSSSSNGKPENLKQKKSIGKSDNENKHENVIKSLNKEVNSCSSKSIISDKSSSSNGKPENLKQKKSIGKSDNENKNVKKIITFEQYLSSNAKHEIEISLRKHFADKPLSIEGNLKNIDKILRSTYDSFKINGFPDWFVINEPTNQEKNVELNSFDRVLAANLETQDNKRIESDKNSLHANVNNNETRHKVGDQIDKIAEEQEIKQSLDIPDHSQEENKNKSILFVSADVISQMPTQSDPLNLNESRFKPIPNISLTEVNNEQYKKNENALNLKKELFDCSVNSVEFVPMEEESPILIDDTEPNTENILKNLNDDSSNQSFLRQHEKLLFVSPKSIENADRSNVMNCFDTNDTLESIHLSDCPVFNNYKNKKTSSDDVNNRPKNVYKPLEIIAKYGKKIKNPIKENAIASPTNLGEIEYSIENVTQSPTTTTETNNINLFNTENSLFLSSQLNN